MKLNKATLSEQIYTIIRNDILNQVIPQGEKLTLKNLQERFSVSSTPIREALTRLSEEGLVNYYSNIGVTVINLKRNDVEELYQFIGDMDALAIFYASEHPDQDELIEKLDRIIKRSMEIHEKETLTTEEIGEWTELSDRFHLVFYDYCGNSRLTTAAAKQRSQLTIVSNMYQADLAVQKEIEKEHTNIYHAYLNKNYEEAVKQMKAHLRQSLKYALHYIELQ
ncbi:MAG: GntR family transcriptional regulator [Lachnospiraceae bacterium]|nr:GntR family transcriptional regulator [Lachnospiraceae bacterium]